MTWRHKMVWHGTYIIGKTNITNSLSWKGPCLTIFFFFFFFFFFFAYGLGLEKKGLMQYAQAPMLILVYYGYILRILLKSSYRKYANCILFKSKLDCYWLDRYTVPVRILHKYIAGRYRPIRVADGPITSRYRFIKNVSWGLPELHLGRMLLIKVLLNSNPFRRIFLWSGIRGEI